MDSEISTLLLSFQVALTSTLIDLPIALLLGIALTRMQKPIRFICEAFIYLPLFLPPIATGYLLLRVLGMSSPLGRWIYETLGYQLTLSFSGAVIAGAVVGLPLFVRPIYVAVRGLDSEYEEVARLHGLSYAKILRRITIPLIYPGIITGGLLCFMRSLGEFGATIMVAGNIEGVSRTLSLALWSSFQQADGEQTALRLLGFSIALALVGFCLAELATSLAKAKRNS